jgi:ABC-2 type transport system permease protein/capsular polysaccharide transport system permease protein
VAALLAREILTRYGRHNIGFLWLFVEPMLFTVGITTLWTITKAVHGSNLPIVAFALTGYSSVLLWRNMPHRCIGAILPSLSLMFHKNVKVIDIFVSRLVLEMAGASVSFVVLSIFFISIGWLDPPEDLLEVLLGWGLLAWFGWAIAMLLGALSEQSEIVEKLWHPAAYLLFPLSGAAFMVDALPKAAQDLVLFIPMVHGVEMVREGYFGSRFIAHYNMYYLISVCSVLTLFAMAKVRAVSRNVVPE